MSRKRTEWHWIAYDPEWDRWVMSMDGRKVELHCGECFRMKLGGYDICCRMELDRDWYVIMGETSFILRPKSRYQIQLMH